MKKWTKTTLWVSLGIGGGIVAFVGLPLAVMAIALSGVDPSNKDPSNKFEDILTSEKIREVNFDKKSEITLEDLNKYFPKINIIDTAAFKDNKILTKIEIPKNINIIRKSAFENSNLNTIEFEQDGELKMIDDNAFKNTKIKSVHLPDSTNSIFNNVFQNTEIEIFYFPSNIFWVGDSVFEDCILLKQVSYIKGSPIFMGSNIFKNASVINYDYRDVFSSSAFAFNNSLQHIDFSLATFVSPYFFSNLLSEIEIVIPNNIKEIGWHAFSNSQLKSIKFDNYISNNELVIYNNAFANCINLIELELPNIQTITLHDNAFAFTHFSDITMPSYLKVNNSSSPLYGFTQAQWDLIKWI